ncbi:hypothetical protein AAVH_35717, partial [Aphelenchoides avenae]
AITPLALCSVPILFFVVAACAGYDMGPEQVFLTMCTHAITIVNPLTTVFFVRSYRDAVASVVRVWCPKKPQSSQATSAVSALSLASVVPAPA